MDTVVVVIIAIVVVVVIIIAGWIIIHKETMTGAADDTPTLVLDYYVATPAQMDAVSKKMQGSGIRLIQKTGYVMNAFMFFPKGLSGRRYPISWETVAKPNLAAILKAYAAKLAN